MFIFIQHFRYRIDPFFIKLINKKKKKAWKCWKKYTFLKF